MILGLFLAFFQIGLFAFGGGFAVLALIQDVIVVQNAWVSQEVFLDIVALSQMTPGPIAVNAATLIGFRVGGVLGAIVATTGVVLPSMLIIYTLIKIIDRYEKTELLQNILKAIRPASLGLIFSAAFLLGKSSLQSFQGVFIFALVGGLSYFKKWNPLILLGGAAVLGLLLF